MDYPDLYAAIVAMALLGLCLYLVLEWVERTSVHGCMCKLGYRSERVFFVLVYEVYFLPPSTPSTPRALSIFPLLCGLCLLTRSCITDCLTGYPFHSG